MAVKSKHPDALSALEKLSNAFPHTEREYELANLYQKFFKDNPQPYAYGISVIKSSR